MSDFEVRGADQFLRLSKALKDAGRTELRKELHKGLREGVKPLIPLAQAEAERRLPSGLKGKGRATKIRAFVTTGKDPGVRIGVPFSQKAGRGLGKSNARLLNNEGIIRHPVFGRRDRWVNQRVPGGKGWFDEPLRAGAPTVRPKLEQAMNDVAERIVREAK